MAWSLLLASLLITQEEEEEEEEERERERRVLVHSSPSLSPSGQFKKKKEIGSVLPGRSEVVIVVSTVALYVHARISWQTSMHLGETEQHRPFKGWRGATLMGPTINNTTCCSHYA